VVPEAARDTVDLISVQHFRTMDVFKCEMAHWHTITGKPIINADFAWHLAPFGRRQPYGVNTHRERGEQCAQWSKELFADVPYFLDFGPWEQLLGTAVPAGPRA
jgi:hypothetical protein